MSKVSLDFEIIFDTSETWRGIDEFESAFAKFLEQSNLLAERIRTSKNDEREFYLYVFKNPVTSVKRSTVVEAPRVQIKQIKEKIK